MYVCVREKQGQRDIGHVHKWQTCMEVRGTVGSHFSPSPCSGKITVIGSAVLCTVGSLLSPLPTLPGITDVCSCIWLFYVGPKN